MSLKQQIVLLITGPEGGDGGGTLVATGTPEEIANVESSYTGKYLKRYLNEIKQNKLNYRLWKLIVI